MRSSVAVALYLLFFSTSGMWAGQEKNASRLILKLDENVVGPYGGQKSKACMRIYSDGKVIYSQWWNSAATLVDSKTQAKSRPEYTSSVVFQMDETDLWELTEFLNSKPVKRLPAEFKPPHRPIDYFEHISLNIFDSKGRSRQISTREFYVADLVEETRYPSALIVLMHKINDIESEATEKGKPTDIPPDCPLKQESK